MHAISTHHALRWPAARADINAACRSAQWQRAAACASGSVAARGMLVQSTFGGTIHMLAGIEASEWSEGLCRASNLILSHIDASRLIATASLLSSSMGVAALPQRADCRPGRWTIGELVGMEPTKAAFLSPIAHEVSTCGDGHSIAAIHPTAGLACCCLQSVSTDLAAHGANGGP